MHALESMEPDSWTWDVSSASGIATNKPVFDGTTVILHPESSFGTSAVRGSKALGENTVAYWEITAPYLYGTSVMFGIGTATSSVYAPLAFENLLGTDSQSYGLSHRGVAQHDGDEYFFCDPFSSESMVTVGVLFDGPSGRLEYFLNGRSVGVAFDKIAVKGTTYYPMVSSTSQRTALTLTNMRMARELRSLTDLSIDVICSSIRNVQAVEELRIPTHMKSAIRERLLYRQAFRRHPNGSKDLASQSGCEYHYPATVKAIADLLYSLTRNQLTEL